MKLSNQAIGALMMALQKSLMEQSDIVPVLRDMNFAFDSEPDASELVVTNPPTVKAQAPSVVLTETDES